MFHKLPGGVTVTPSGCTRRTEMKEQMVRATLKSTYGYFNARKGIKENFGPGQDILIPKGLAYSLGIPYQPAEANTPTEDNPPAEDDLSLLDLRPDVLDALKAEGFTTFASIAAATDEALIAVKGVGAQTASRIKALAQEQLG
jgi:DNA-directed RNA polymerase alpha subunit